MDNSISYRKFDISGHLFKYIRRIRLAISQFYFTIIMRIELKLRGAEFSRKVTFIGKTSLNRYQNSKISIGKGCFFVSNRNYNLAGVSRRCMISTLNRGAEIIIGEESSFSGTVIGCTKKITIGKNVLCGANTFITDYDWHNIDPKRRNESCTTGKEVTIEDNVWLGLNVVVLKGVRIGKNSVIGANSIVTQDIPENVIAAGNPCRILNKLSYYDN